MPDLDGFGVIAEVGLEEMPQVVFVTAYDQHAIRAFEINAVDYLVKPYTSDRFNAAVDRAIERVERRAKSEPDNAAEESRMLTLVQRVFGEEEQVPGSDRIIVRDRDFVRVHRRFLVNLDRVTEVQPWFGGDAIVVLSNNTKVRLSRTFRETFEKRFLSP